MAGKSANIMILVDANGVLMAVETVVVFVASFGAVWGDHSDSRVNHFCVQFVANHAMLRSLLGKHMIEELLHQCAYVWPSQNAVRLPTTSIYNGQLVIIVHTPTSLKPIDIFLNRWNRRK